LINNYETATIVKTTSSIFAIELVYNKKDKKIKLKKSIIEK
jgi:hypothetical protein